MLKQAESKVSESQATDLMEDASTEEGRILPSQHIGMDEIDGDHNCVQQIETDQTLKAYSEVSKGIADNSQRSGEADRTVKQPFSKVSESQGVKGGEMVKEIIHDIRATEAEAHRIVEEAKRSRADALSKAREEAKKMLEQVRKQGEQMIKDGLARASQEVSRRVAEIGEQEAKDVEAIRAKAQPRVGKAVELVLSRILK